MANQIKTTFPLFSQGKIIRTDSKQERKETRNKNNSLVEGE